MFVDVNCSLGEWPFRDLTISSHGEFDRHLGGEGIEVAFVSPVASILAADPYEKNSMFIDAATNSERLYPVPVLNPRVRRWFPALRHYAEHGVKAVKLYPNYHGYNLDDPQCEECLAAIEETDIVVMLPLRVEDERFHHPLMQVPPVDIADIRSCADSHREMTFIGLNGYRNELVDADYGSVSNLYLDFAFAERNRTIEDLLEKIPVDRLLFGSNSPFFTTRAATMKLDHARIDDAARQSIAGENAKRIFSL